MFGVGVSLWKTTILASGIAAPPASDPIVANQSLDFGALTKASAGGDTPTNTGATITSASIDSGDASTHWQISATGEITPTAAGDTADLNLGPYALVCTFNSSGGTDTATITITPTADTFSVAPSVSETQLETVTEGALTRGVHTILLRSGNYNTAQADLRTKRTTSPTGGAGYVTIEPHTGATPIFGRWSVDGININPNYFHFKDLTFLGTNDGSHGGSAAYLLAFINGAGDCKVSGCTIGGPVTTETSGADVAIGVKVTTGDRVLVHDNNISYVYDGISITGDDAEAIGNTIEYAFNDGIKQSDPCPRFKGNWNIIKNKKVAFTEVTVTGITLANPCVVTVTDGSVVTAADTIRLKDIVGTTELHTNFTNLTVSSVSSNELTLNVDSTSYTAYVSGGIGEVSSLHPDFIQGAFSGALAADIADMEYIGNILFRGNSTEGWGDGQGIFLDDNSNSMADITVLGNMYIGTAFNGTYGTRSATGRWKNNTIVTDLTTSTITSRMIFGANTSENFAVDNVMIEISDSGTNNNVLTNTAVTETLGGYQAIFNNPTFDSDLTDPITDYAVLSGIRGGAGSGRVNYAARTHTIPPYLIVPVGTKTGETTADLDIETDGSDGTMYWVLSSSATVPTSAQVKAGNDHTGSAALKSGNQAVSAKGDQDIAVTGLTASTTYFAHFAHENTVGSISVVDSASSFTTDAAVSYTQNFVDTNATGWVNKPTEADSAVFTLGAWIKPNTLNSVNYIMHISGRSSVTVSASGTMTVVLKDSVNTTVYNGTTSTVFSVGPLSHVEIAVDLSVPSIRIEVDGVDVADASPATAITTGSGSIDFTRAATGLLAGSAGASVFDCEVCDLFLDTTQVLTSGTLYNSGTPPDPTSIGAPSVWLGGSMVAADWDTYDNEADVSTDNTNALTLTAGATGFTDV